MSVQAAIRTTIGNLDIEVSLVASPGGVTAILGPNGAGKSTILRAIAGLHTPTAGRIAIGNQVVFDSTANLNLRPEQRRIGLVFQDRLLFPHLSVLENVAFGPRSIGRSKVESRKIAQEHLELVSAGDLSALKPHQLSGGGSQRVALARALATQPSALLLDEPTSSLDLESRAAVRADLATHLSRLEIPTILVTHDPLEAGTLAKRIAIIEEGRVTHDSDLAEITMRPKTTWAARLVGTNLYRGELYGSVVKLGAADIVTTTDGEGRVFVAIPPRTITLHLDRPQGSARNVWRGRIDSIEVLGGTARVHIEGELPMVAEVTLTTVSELRLMKGAEVWAAVKATEVDCYPA